MLGTLIGLLGIIINSTSGNIFNSDVNLASIQITEDDWKKITLKTQKGSDVEGKHCLIDFETQEEIDEQIISDLSKAQNATLKRNPTTRFNCYSYAFYDNSYDTNKYCIDEPSAFINDGSYKESKGDVGDTLVYYDIYGIPTHAAIVLERIREYENNTNDLYNVIVESKFGYGGLYEHVGIDCNYNFRSIKYFKINLAHEHNYSSYVYKDSKQHYEYCKCGKYITVGHVVASGSFKDGKRYATCLKCGGNAEMGFELSTLNYDYNENFVDINGENYFRFSTYYDGVINLSYEDFKEYNL